MGQRGRPRKHRGNDPALASTPEPYRDPMQLQRDLNAMNLPGYQPPAEESEAEEAETMTTTEPAAATETPVRPEVKIPRPDPVPAAKTAPPVAPALPPQIIVQSDALSRFLLGTADQPINLIRSIDDRNEIANDDLDVVPAAIKAVKTVDIEGEEIPITFVALRKTMASGSEWIRLGARAVTARVPAFAHLAGTPHFDDHGIAVYGDLAIFYIPLMNYQAKKDSDRARHARRAALAGKKKQGDPQTEAVSFEFEAKTPPVGMMI